MTPARYLATSDIELSAENRRLINLLQQGFPVCHAPFAEAAQVLDMTEQEVLQRVEQLLHQGVLTRFGPLYQIERAGGRFVLCAMCVPEERFDEVTECVNALPEVAHNYRREHALNMWFVIAVEQAGDEEQVCTHIECVTGFPVMAFPKEQEYFVSLFLPA